MERIEVKSGRPPKEQAEAIGDHLVTVAGALFAEHGYGATSMAMIAARARVGKQTLYRRFPEKGALFQEVMRRRIDAVITPQAEGTDGCDPLGELKRLGRAALDMILDPEFVRLFRTIIAEALVFPELACAASDNWGSSFAARCVDAIAHAQATGGCRPGDPEQLAHCFLWSLFGDAFLKGLTGVERLQTKSDRDAHLEVVWRVFLKGISVAK